MDWTRRPRNHLNQNLTVSTYSPSTPFKQTPSVMDSKNDPLDPPAYTESAPTYAPNLHSQISTIRSNRISTLINSTLLPQLSYQAASGISHKILILVPSDITPLQHPSSSSADIDSKDPQAPSLPTTDHPLGFPPDVSVRLIHLHGADNVLEFWRQPAVITRLQTELSSQLTLSHPPLQASKAEESLASSPPATSPPPTKKGFFGRMSAKTVPKARSGWSVGEDSTPVLGTGEIKVEVRLTEVSVRVVTEMGLYETRSGDGVVVEVQVGD
jgi:hypothetical protein